MYEYAITGNYSDLLKFVLKAKTWDGFINNPTEAHLGLSWALLHWNRPTNCFTINVVARATKAGNRRVMEKLIERYRVKLIETIDQRTGETALHIACKKVLPLRYYITQSCPELLFSLNLSGVQPLHLACQNNDLEYITWLFQNVLRDSEAEELCTQSSCNVFLSLQSNSRGSPCLSPSPHESPFHFQSCKIPSQTSEPSLVNMRKSHCRTDSNISERDEHWEMVRMSHVSNNLQLQDFDQNGHDFDENGQQEYLEKRLSIHQLVTDETSDIPIEILTLDPEVSLRPHPSPHILSPPPSFSMAPPLSNISPPPSLISPPASVSPPHTGSHSTSHSSGRQGSHSPFQDNHNSIKSRTSLSRPNSSSSTRSSTYNETDTFLYYYSMDTATTSLLSTLVNTVEMVEETSTEYGPSPLDLEKLISIHSRLFSVSASGLSILHIAARYGYSELLSVILRMVVYFSDNPQYMMCDGGDFNTVLTRKDSSLTPVEEAIVNKQTDCLHILLNFASSLPIFAVIVEDHTLLSQAVQCGSVDVLKMLLGFGLWSGIKEATEVAFSSGHALSLQILLFCYTQLMCAQFATCKKRGGAIRLGVGSVKWDNLGMGEFDPNWLTNAQKAVRILAHVLKVNNYKHPVHKDINLLKTLGKELWEYFNVHVWQAVTQPVSWAQFPLTTVSLSGNRLTNIPEDLFQIKSLESLDLSNNRLTSLPSSLNFQQPLYTCSKLRILQLHQNHLQTLPEDLLYTVGNSLEELNAQDNSISSLPPVLWICTRLHTLLLGRNSLTQLHYLSTPNYYYDMAYTRKINNSLCVDESGNATRPDRLNDEEFTDLMLYTARLNIFHQAVDHLLPEVIASRESSSHAGMTQYVVDLHWLRAELNRDTEASFELMDISLPSREACSITVLDLSQNRFEDFPWDLPCVVPNLEKLDFRDNKVGGVSLIQDMPASIASIIMSSNALQSVTRVRGTFPCGSPVKLLSGYVTNPMLSGQCCHASHHFLDKLTNLILTDNTLVKFPCVRTLVPCPAPQDLPPSLDNSAHQTLFPSLSVLSLDQNNLDAVPGGIHHLSMLSSLNLSHNPGIIRIPHEMGLLSPHILLLLKLEGLDIKNIPVHLLNNKSSARPMLTYLKSMYHK